MANGFFGINRPSDVAISDVEIFYKYSKDRTTLVESVIRLNPSELLEKINHPERPNTILGGLYNLKLPTTIFSQVGFYTIYIKPKEIKTVIRDCGILIVRPDVKGIILDINALNPSDRYRLENNGLVGYRIEYFETNPNVSERKIQNTFRIITSNFRVEPVTDNLNNTTQKNVKYRLNDNSSLVFCTVTPSTAFSLKPNIFPYIGTPNQEIILTNTYFDPIMLEVEIVEHNFDTLAIGIFGNQTKDIQTGIRTYFDTDNEIYKQFNEYVIKDDFNNNLFEVKENKEDIDFSQEFDRIKAQ